MNDVNKASSATVKQERLETFEYLMDCYFYQFWMSEFPQAKDALVCFARKENLDIVNNLISDIKYIIENNLSKKVFECGEFDFDPLLEGFSTEKEWFEFAHKVIIEHFIE